MKTAIRSQAEHFTKEHKSRSRWHKVVTMLAAIVVFYTTYVLILPAITWERSLVREKQEHVHTSSCYAAVPGDGEHLCPEAEHTHGPECYEQIMVCGMIGEDGHIHTNECYQEILICSVPEHIHTDSCFGAGAGERTVLVCGLEEHQHTDRCFDAPPAEEREFFCGREEHIHSEEQGCYFEDGTLKCTISEHEHTLQCRSDPAADVETPAYWESTFASVELTGDWAGDVLAIAETQKGYTESDRNYTVSDDGETKMGYTRYGDWYGIPYGDWCAMFCSFCLDYAGVHDFPLCSNCERWIRTLTYDESMPDRPAYYREAGAYIPNPGDLIFFDWDPYFGEGRCVSDHVGFVKEVVFDEVTGEPLRIVTIEGNSAGQVRENVYPWTDETILGYGALPLNPEYREERTIRSLPASDGAVAAVTGLIPDGAEVIIEAVHLSEEELESYFGKNMAEAMQSFAAYDIRILANGVEWQPDETVSVTVEHLRIDAPAEELAVAHISDSDNSVSSLTAQAEEDGSISFDTDGFSVYVFYVFTVDYSFEGMEYHQQGMSTLYLSELMAALGIDRSAAEVEFIEFSRPELLRVEAVVGDWALISLQAFDSPETLTLRFTDGSEITVNVSDAVTVKRQITDTYNLITTATDIELLLERYNVRENLGIPANTTVKSISVTPQSDTFKTKTENGKYYIVCTAEFTAPRTCQVVFNATEDGNDIACEFTGITGDTTGKYTLWDYSGGKNGVNSPKIIEGNFENLIEPTSSRKDWAYPRNATDNSNIHTDNAPIGFSKAVLSTRGRDTVSNYKINPIEIVDENGVTQKYYLYVSSKATTAYNGSGYSSGGNAPSVSSLGMGRYTAQDCSLPCVKSGLLLVCWIEDEPGNKVVLPNVCVGNEGASTLWNWRFGGQGSKTILTNDIPVTRTFLWNTWTEGGLEWDTSSGTVVSAAGRYQGVPPDENGYYTLQLSGSNVDELSVFRFSAFNTVKKTVLNEDGTPLTGASDTFDFGVTYTPQVSITSGYSTESFTLKNGETQNINGAIDTTCDAWEIVDPLYSTTVKMNGTTVQNPVKETITPTDGGEPYDVIRAPQQTISTTSTTIEFINRKLPVARLTLTKQVTGKDTTEAFDFTATAQSGEIYKGRGYTLVNGEARFSLPDDGSVTLLVSKGATVAVTEADDGVFNVTYTGANGYHSDGRSAAFQMDADRAITVTNSLKVPLPSTGGHGRFFIYALGTALLTGAAVYAVRRRRRKTEE